MEGFGLLIGHLLGDFLFQNDWMAGKKTNPPPGKKPCPCKVRIEWAPKRDYPGPWSVEADPSDLEGFRAALDERNRKIDEWDTAEQVRVDRLAKMDAERTEEQQRWYKAKLAWREGHLACTVHCVIYTLAVWVCCWWWMPWWGMLVCFLLHWPIDRFRLARLWMERVSGQKAFANGPLAPWSVIVVDNTFHLLTLYGITWLANAA